MLNALADRESLVLRPGSMHTLLIAGIPLTAFAAIGSWILLGGRLYVQGWVIVALVWVAGGGALLLAARSRLILTPQGFRLRWLLKGRLVPWTAVARFYPAQVRGWGSLVESPGVAWLPKGLQLPESAMGFLDFGIAAANRGMPTFGRSRDEMLQTLNAWLDRYGGPSA
jgi:hypothetical protein